MGADYIPERDGRAGCWMKFFARALVNNPGIYRTTPDDAAQIEAAVVAFRTAQAIAWPKGTRTRGMVRAKNAARKSAEQLVRPAAKRIRNEPRISDELKINIGLPPGRKRRRHPRERAGHKAGPEVFHV